MLVVLVGGVVLVQLAGAVFQQDLAVGNVRYAAIPPVARFAATTRLDRDDPDARA